MTSGYDLFYNWFDILKAKGNDILGYVIMPNHLHSLIYYKNIAQSLNTMIGNGKRFIGYELVKRLFLSQDHNLLKQMQLAVNNKDSQRGKKHQIWQPSFEAKECRTEKFILQKLNYIHNNPCTPRWQLAEKPYQYPHSSAAFYNGNKKGYPIIDYEDVLSEVYSSE